MSCPAIETGHNFLGAMLTHIDCQAQTIGSYGYGALANPGSPIAAMQLALLTIFVALFGLRLMLGSAPAGKDLVGDFLKLGIVLTIATSWPAWRTLGYDLVLSGPSQIASSVGGASGLPGSGNNLNARLQNADDGIVSITMFGTGRLTGGISNGADLGDSTRGIALADQSGFAWGRVLFLAGTIGPLAIVRLSAGILLALAPLLAGMLLFAGTRDIFLGWLRALGACALGALVLTLIYGTELAILESWLGDALGQREANALTPSAPTELLVTTLAFSLVSFGALALVVKLMFFTSPGLSRLFSDESRKAELRALSEPNMRSHVSGASGEQTRAQQLADTVAYSVRREGQILDPPAPGERTAVVRGAMAAVQQSGPAGREALGSNYRRSYRRNSAAAGRRDASS